MPALSLLRIAGTNEVRLEPERHRPPAAALPLLAGIDLPRGAVVELVAPSGLGRATQLAQLACATAQRESRAIAHDGRSRWCGWVDAGGSLYAPAMAEAGVDLTRLLVVRPDEHDVARVAVRMATSHLFTVLVIDRTGVPGASVATGRTRWDVAARRLALACESSDTTVVLLGELERARADALPVAMRIELTRPEADRLRLRVVKDRRGVDPHARLVALLPRGLARASSSPLAADESRRLA